MRADIQVIVKASLHVRQELDAHQERFGPKPWGPPKTHEPCPRKPLSELAKVLSFLRTYRTDDPPAAPVTILYKDGKPYEMTDAEKVRAAEEARTQRELEKSWSTPERRRLMAKIEHAAARRRNEEAAILLRYGIIVGGEINWSIFVFALRKVEKPLKEFLQPLFAQDRDRDVDGGQRLDGYYAPLTELLRLVKSKLRKQAGYQRRPASLDLRADVLCGLPAWMYTSRREELVFCKRIDCVTRRRLVARVPKDAARADPPFHTWRGNRVRYYPELHDFYRFPYCDLPNSALVDEVDGVHGQNLEYPHKLALLAAAKKNQEMVQRRERAEYFLGPEPCPERRARPVHAPDALGNEKGDSAALDEILRISESEARRAVRGLSYGSSSITTVTDRFFYDLRQDAAVVALTETQTDNRLPLSDAPLRGKIRSRLKREIGRLKMRDYHYGEGLTDTDGLTAEEEALEMLLPSAFIRFDTQSNEAIVADGPSAEEPAGDARAFRPTERVQMNEPIDDEPLRARLVMIAHSEGPGTEHVGDWEKLAKVTLDEREAVIVAETWKGWTAAEIGKRMGCHQTTVQRALKGIAERANAPEPV